jgi:hypothetical protein
MNVLEDSLQCLLSFLLSLVAKLDHLLTLCYLVLRIATKTFVVSTSKQIFSGGAFVARILKGFLQLVEFVLKLLQLGFVTLHSGFSFIVFDTKLISFDKVFCSFEFFLHFSYFLLSFHSF